jgi:hypothetical protein
VTLERVVSACSSCRVAATKFEKQDSYSVAAATPDAARGRGVVDMMDFKSRC